MIWYMLNIFTLTICWLLLNDKGISVGERILSKEKCFLAFATFNWVILSGCRHISIGADTEAYKIYMFDPIQRMSWGEIWNSFSQVYIDKTGKDPGYMVLEKLFQYISTNYQIWLIAIALFFFIFMAKWVDRYSKNPYLSYILFSCLFYSFFAITGHRQTIATAMVVMIGTQLAEEKKLIKFLILVLIASTVHASAICFLVFYIIIKIPINKVTLSSYWIFIGLAYLFRGRFMEFLQEIVGYESYTYLEGAGAGVFIYLLLLVSIVITVFHNYLLDEGVNPISIHAVMFSTVMSSLVLINPSMMRVVQYFSLFLMIIISDLISLVKEENQRIVSFIVVSLLCLLLLNNNPTYYFFFSQLP